MRSPWFAVHWAACSSRNARALRLSPVLLMISGLGCCALGLVAQTSDSTTTGQPNKPWTATTDFRSDFVPARIPVRIIESHSQNGDRTFRERSVQILGVDGRLAPYQEIETETLQVDATTVRTTMRTFGRDINGEKSLIQVTEEKNTLCWVATRRCCASLSIPM